MLDADWVAEQAVNRAVTSISPKIIRINFLFIFSPFNWSREDFSRG